MQSAILIKLPERFGSKEAKKLRQELNRKLSSDIPSLVVDLSRVRQIDLAGLEGLLNCMETVAKNDGTLQLGEISPEAATILELTRVDKLLQKFPVTEVPATFQHEEVLAETSEENVGEKIVQAQPVAA
ncbi:MAG TPA: STAS domain-containing protein [Terriglobales bacterium]|nr:STAS domain-containing protein [Terriglobales bacterium]